MMIDDVFLGCFGQQMS